METPESEQTTGEYGMPEFVSMHLVVYRFGWHSTREAKKSRSPVEYSAVFFGHMRRHQQIFNYIWMNDEGSSHPMCAWEKGIEAKKKDYATVVIVASHFPRLLSETKNGTL